MRVKGLANEVISHLLLTSVGVFSQLLIAPLYIRDFGQQGYSRISIILSLCAFALISDYGLYITASNRLVQIFKTEGYFALVLWRKYLRSVFLVFIVVAPILYLYFITSATKNPKLWEGLKHETIIFLLFLGAASTSLIQHSLLIKYQLIDNFGRGLRILAILRLAEVSILAICLYLKMNLVVFAIVTFFVRALSTAFIFMLTRRLLDVQKVKSQALVVGDGFILFRQSVPKALFNLANLLGLHGTMLVASLWIEPRLLFSMLIARMITSPVRFLSDSLINGGLPRLTNHFRKLGDRSEMVGKASNNFRVVVFACLGFIILFAGTSILGPILWRYLSLSHAGYPRVLILFFLVSTYLDAVSAVMAMLGIARHKDDRIQYVYFASTILALVLQYVMRYWWGVYSVPVSLLIGDLAFMLFAASRVSMGRISK